MAYCEDCGYGPTSNGICSACQEELYILEFQSDVIDEPLSGEFMEKAAEQRQHNLVRESSPERGR